MRSIPGGIAHAEQEWAILKGRLRHFTDLPVPEVGIPCDGSLLT